MQLSKAIEGFLLFKRSEGLSPRTLETYELHLRYLKEFTEDAELKDITTTDILKFLDYMRNGHVPQRWSGSKKPLSSQTIRNIWIALRSFYKWVNQTLDLPNVMLKVPAPKANTAERTPFTAEEVKALLQQVTPQRGRRRYLQLLRDQAIIYLLLDTGIRASELCQLKIDDVHLSSGRTDISGKGSKQRYVYLADLSRRAVWQYLAERPDGDDPQAPLFATRRGTPMKRGWLRKRLNIIGNKAGVEDVYPHRFRYTFAIQYLRNGGDIFTLQMLLGHSSLKMVRYYAKLANVDAAQAHASSSPVDRWLK